VVWPRLDHGEPQIGLADLGQPALQPPPVQPQPGGADTTITRAGTVSLPNSLAWYKTVGEGGVMSPLSGRGGVFISYRREETASYAGRLYDRLGDRFGEDSVFMDINSIAVGVDFTTTIAGAMSRCNILFVLIGQRWIAITDGKGKRRIDIPGDFVRIEIEAALQRDVWVVPVLVDGAVLPRADDLPRSLRPLIRHQALELSHAGFRSEVVPLIAAVAQALEAGPGRSAAPKIPSRGAVTQQGRWQLELLKDTIFTKTFRLSSGSEVHDITYKTGATKGAIEVDGKLEVTLTGPDSPLKPFHLKALSTTLGCDVTIQCTSTWNFLTTTRFKGEARLPYAKRTFGPIFKPPRIDLLILTIGDQVVRYEFGTR
jgi:TIR domain